MGFVPFLPPVSATPLPANGSVFLPPVTASPTPVVTSLNQAATAANNSGGSANQSTTIVTDAGAGSNGGSVSNPTSPAGVTSTGPLVRPTREPVAPAADSPNADSESDESSAAETASETNPAVESSSTESDPAEPQTAEPETTEPDVGESESTESDAGSMPLVIEEVDEPTGGLPESEIPDELAFVDAEPFAVADTFTLAPGIHQLRVTNNDGYAEETPGVGLTLVAVDDPPIGTASVFDRESLSVEIPASAIGEVYEFGYKVLDAVGEEDRGVVTISVTEDGRVGVEDEAVEDGNETAAGRDLGESDSSGSLLSVLLPLLLIGLLGVAALLFLARRRNREGEHGEPGPPRAPMPQVESTTQS